LSQGHEIPFTQECEEIVANTGIRSSLSDEHALKALQERGSNGNHTVAVRKESSRVGSSCNYWLVDTKAVLIGLVCADCATVGEEGIWVIKRNKTDRGGL